MTEQQYVEEIKGKILESLKIEYEATLPNKAELEQNSKDTLIKLIQNQPLYDQIANEIKNWSFDQASTFRYMRKPEVARGFLSLISIRDFVNASVKNYEQSLQNNQQTR